MPEYQVLCYVCNQPSAIFTDLEGVLVVPVRLAKTMVRISQQRGAEARYVHEDPCLRILGERLQQKKP